MSIFLKYGSIEGESTTDTKTKWIQLDSLQWGMGRGINMPSGGATSKREASEVSVSEVTITKAADKATPKLVQEALFGKMNTKAEIAFTRTKPDGGVEDFMMLTLFDTAVSGYSMSSGGDNPSESLSLNFAKFDLKYTSYDAAGVATPEIVTYDMTKRTK
ncbi:Hcp family type VI secretion system effector [Limobrevibacterium gyesilva]|uniref:Type VI secretion system tube protein Hcp n=1 Tax=Limobrevibacterium gyesilva TaxID=2991712 RepID=A0AA41YI40_9PROT|nr:type VI secretion system tube protein Hcp [Limobrevibacterium gyesilva]MCW3473901.1 type VI secretion system tube protein Hcp [Limobrevibacterium gyesilva]